MTDTTPRQPPEAGSDAAPAEVDGERRQIRDAMDRLLAGEPLHSDGKLTIKSLAAEARVKRWLLTHKHTDLQVEFRARAEQQGRQPAAVQSLLDENAELLHRLDDLSQRLTTERETVKRLERVVNVLTLQLEDLRRGDAASPPLRLLRPGGDRDHQ